MGFNDFAGNGGRRNVLVHEAQAILVHPEIARLHGDAYAKGAVVAEVLHVIEQGVDREVIRAAVRGLLGHQMAVAVLALAPANRLIEVLARVASEQGLVRGHAARCEHDGLGLVIDVFAVLRLGAHAFDRVFVGKQQLRRRGFGKNLEAVFLFSSGSELLDSDFAIAALVECGSLALLRPADAVGVEQPAEVFLRIAEHAIKKHGVAHAIAIGLRTSCCGAGFFFGVFKRASACRAFGHIGRAAERIVLLEQHDAFRAFLNCGERSRKAAHAGADNDDVDFFGLVGLLGVGRNLKRSGPEVAGFAGCSSPRALSGLRFARRRAARQARESSASGNNRACAEERTTRHSLGFDTHDASSLMTCLTGPSPVVWHASWHRRRENPSMGIVHFSWELEHFISSITVDFIIRIYKRPGRGHG